MTLAVSEDLTPKRLPRTVYRAAGCVCYIHEYRGDILAADADDCPVHPAALFNLAAVMSP